MNLVLHTSKLDELLSTVYELLLASLFDLPESSPIGEHVVVTDAASSLASSLVGPILYLSICYNGFKVSTRVILRSRAKVCVTVAQVIE